MVSPSPMSINSWELRALKYEFPAQPTANSDNGEVAAAAAWRQLQDPIIYPGIYSASGYDVMSLLLRVMSRPNPKIELGAVDCSVSIVLCDLSLPDSPIVYASESFCELTGYSSREILGRNCRFLQKPPKSTMPPLVSTNEAEKSAIKRIRHAVRAREEIQCPVINFKRNGERFTNLLSIIPLEREASGHHYAVGFQVQVE